MSDSSNNFERRAWLGRVRSADAGRAIVGACFAVDARHLLTCAHVVRDAGAAGPGERVWVDFPLRDGHEGHGGWAVVCDDGWRDVSADEPSVGDVALLRVADDAPDLEPLPLRARRSYDGLPFAAYGFPEGHAASDAAHGALGLHVGVEWLRIESVETALVEPGFSGAAVWADSLGGAVAMIVTRQRGNGRVAYGIPLDLVARTCDVVRAALAGSADPLAWRDTAPRALAGEILRVDDLLRERTDGFVGRDFVFAALRERLTDAAFPSGYVVIRGEPGIGKSAVMAQLARTQGHVHHFNIFTDNVRSPARFLRNACAQLVVRYALPHDELPLTVADDATVLVRLLTEAVAAADGAPVVLLVDALDEAEDPPTGVNRLHLPARLPDGAYVVATIRDGVDLRIAAERRARDIELREQSDENQADIRAYVRAFVLAHADEMADRMAALGTDAPALEDALWVGSEGNFMYLHHVLRDILGGRINPNNLASLGELPAGLQRYYDRHWALMESTDRERFRRVQRPVLAVLANAREAVSAETIARWISDSGTLRAVDAEEVEDVFNEWAQFVHATSDDPPRYRLYHKSFLEFLRRRVDLDRYGRAIAATMAAKVAWDAP